MAEMKVLDMSGAQVGTIDLCDSVFAVEVNEAILHAAVRMYLLNQRQGTQSALTRTEVSGGGKKPYRQKGTGNARQGSIRAPQYRKGGVVFAPKPRDYSFSVPKKVKRLALKGALASKVAEDSIKVVDVIAVDEIKTKTVASMLGKLDVAGKKTMILIKENDEKFVKSARNIPGVIISFVETLNVVDLLNYDNLIASKAAVEMIEEVYR